MSKLPRLSRCQNFQEDLDVKNPRASLRDPNYQEAYDVQITKGSKLPDVEIAKRS